MRAYLRSGWQSRSPRERRILLVLAGVMAAACYAWFVYSAGRDRMHLRESVMQLRAQSVLLDAQATELGRLRAAPPATASPMDLRALVQVRIDNAGLASRLTRIDAPEPNRVIVTFGTLPFADWLAWITSLQAQQVRLERCRIEALSTSGLVSVTATLVRAGS